MTTRRRLTLAGLMLASLASLASTACRTTSPGAMATSAPVTPAAIAVVAPPVEPVVAPIEPIPEPVVSAVPHDPDPVPAPPPEVVIARVATIDELFATLDKRFRPAAAAGLTATLHFRLSGKNVAAHSVTIADGQSMTQKGFAGRPDLIVQGRASDYLSFMNGDDAGTRAVLSGKLKFVGNAALAHKMNALFPPAKPAR